MSKAVGKFKAVKSYAKIVINKNVHPMICERDGHEFFVDPGQPMVEVVREESSETSGPTGDTYTEHICTHCALSEGMIEPA